MTDTAASTESKHSLPELPDTPHVTVVFSIYTDKREPYLYDAVDATLNQTYDHYDIVIVVDDNPHLASRIKNRYEDRTLVSVIDNPDDDGLSASRNTGAEHADGEIVAFTDDDALPSKDWLEHIVATYTSTGAVGVGGPAHAEWETGTNGQPYWLPESFNWLVGVDDTDFRPENERQVRNTFGCNITFQRDPFLEEGGFPTSLGKQDGTALQGEEAAISDRLNQNYENGFVYTPDASIRHRVFSNQVKPLTLVKRSYLQGLSKATLKYREGVSNDDTESGFLGYVLGRVIPKELIHGIIADSERFSTAIMAVIYTCAVGLGFLRGAFEYKMESKL